MPEDLTQQVLGTFAGTPEPRLRELISSLASHLHAFATETGLTRQTVYRIQSDPASAEAALAAWGL